MWISAFMLLGVHHGGITVGDVQSKHAEDLKKMVGEMMKLLEEEGVKFKPGLSHITERQKERYKYTSRQRRCTER
jgi:hypothetical protein